MESGRKRNIHSFMRLIIIVSYCNSFQTMTTVLTLMMIRFSNNGSFPVFLLDFVFLLSNYGYVSDHFDSQNCSIVVTAFIECIHLCWDFVLVFFLRQFVHHNSMSFGRKSARIVRFRVIVGPKRN